MTQSRQISTPVLILGLEALMGVLASKGLLCVIEQCTRQGTKAKRQGQGATAAFPWLD